jgi:DNA polymerase I
VEHDPLLYEDAGEMVEYLAQALKQTSREATILLYSPALDPHLQKMTELGRSSVLPSMKEKELR